MGRGGPRASLVLAVAVAVALAPDAAPASAGRHCEYKAEGTAAGGTLVADTIKECPGGGQGAPTGAAPQTTTQNQVEVPPRCEEALEILGVETDELDVQCGHHILLETDDEEPQVTPGLIRRAVDSFEIPAPELQIQPPNGRTLVNFDTNFYTESDVLHRGTTLLGQRIEFRIIPQSYTWSFGDGDEQTTATPGAPYPDLEVTHRYLQKGTFAPQLTTTYTAEYRLNGGGWAPVPGELTVADDPQSLEATTAKPVLVAPDGGP